MSKGKIKRPPIATAKFDLYLNIAITGERFKITHVTAETKIKKLKIHVELVTGIPYSLQRLHYLDKTDLIDSSELRQNDIVPGATIDLKLWKVWENVVRVLVHGTVYDVMALGLSPQDSWTSLDKVYYRHKVESAKEKLQTALLIAAHRNRADLLKALLELGADVNYKTSMGRSALHMAASQGNSECIDMLLEKGASVEVSDIEGKTPVHTANAWGEKDSERHLFLHQWQTRAAKVNPKKDQPLMMHQRFDSSIPTWLQGDYGQIYHASTISPGEYSGSRLNSPLRKPTKPKGMYVDNSGQSRTSVKGHTHFGAFLDDLEREEEDSDIFEERRRLISEESNISTDTLAANRQRNITKISVNDGSRYCKGGYYINSLARLQKHSNIRKSTGHSMEQPNISTKNRRKR